MPNPAALTGVTASVPTGMEGLGPAGPPPHLRAAPGSARALHRRAGMAAHHVRGEFRRPRHHS